MVDLRLGDCSLELKNLEDNSIDLICIDPPYEINYQNLNWDGKDLDWNFFINQFHRILKCSGNLIIFQGWSNVVDLLNLLNTSKNNWILKNWIIYDRIKGRGAKTNVVSTREDILWFTKTKKDYNFNKIYSNIPKKTKGMGEKNGQPNRALSNVWTDISPLVPWSKEKVKHPTQKPVKLMERIVTVFSNENDLVLDCFMGSGSTGVACRNLNRNFIGIEKDKEYFEIAEERVYRR